MKCPHCGVDKPDDARFCGACGRAATGTEPSYKELTGAVPVQTADIVGREIAGRYRVLTKLGEGGMGAVYRGEQISLKRKVAIKVLRPELSRDPALVRRFNAEAELVARLSHPHTVNIYDFGQDADGSLFIAMEFLEGRSLRQVMTQEGPLPPWRALAIARQIAAALADAHGHGIVHRDLKPDNVMLTERGKDKDVVRVLDFGIAKLRDDDRQTVNAMTRAGDLIGTPQYMAPEQIRGEPVDGRTDVYALGAMLYEMLTGRLPFEGPTVMAILSKHLTDTPEPPTVRRPDLGLPRELDVLVMTALAKDPAQRQPTMERLGEDVAHLHAQLGGAGMAGPRSAMMSAPQVVQRADHQTPLPMPSGPPPGVPRTYPPGAMQPLPVSAPPSSHGPMAGPMPGPVPGPVPMPPMTTPAAYAMSGASKKSKAPLVIALVVLLAAGGGAAAYFATRSSSRKPVKLTA
ncbi:MAG: protein kinase, partial [Deltaproteobacteria bacterium]|nr:protein kinase [Kofleriaceae bacterium]